MLDPCATLFHVLRERFGLRLVLARLVRTPGARPALPCKPRRRYRSVLKPPWTRAARVSPMHADLASDVLSDSITHHESNDPGYRLTRAEGAEGASESRAIVPREPRVAAPRRGARAAASGPVGLAPGVPLGVPPHEGARRPVGQGGRLRD